MDQDLSFWHYDELTLPNAARSPWQLVGAGATLAGGRGAYLSATAVSGYERPPCTADLPNRPRTGDRIELQAVFQGQTSAPVWASGASGHALWIDDGERKVGVSIGDVIRFIDPDTGDVIYTPARQPGGWTAEQAYVLCKRGSSRWTLHVAGRLVAVLPYLAAPQSTRLIPAMGFGWRDGAGAGAGWWRQVEHGCNVVLAPQWGVDRIKNSLPTPMRETYSRNTRAILRALVGINEGVRDRVRAAPVDTTADLLPWREARFDGSALPTLAGWQASDPAVLEVRRERLRFLPGDSTERLTWTFDTPVNGNDAVFYLRTWVRVEDYTSESGYGKVGPFIQIRDGFKRVGAHLVFDQANPSCRGWRLTDGNVDDTTEQIGTEVGWTDPSRDRKVELWVIGRDRVVLVVDDLLIEDCSYELFAASTASYEVRLGRMGQDSPNYVRATVEFSDTYAAIYYADASQRTAFLQRIAESSLFFGGLESNARLSAWTRARPAAFERRGTLGVIHEIRRIACDDESDLVRQATPADWYAEVSYPEVTPTFIEARGDVYDTTAQFRALSPIIPPDELKILIEKYLLPGSLIESEFRARLVTELTGPMGGGFVLPVQSTDGFSVGDAVTLRDRQVGALVLTVSYDLAHGLGSDVGVRDYSGGDYHGTLTPGSNSQIRWQPGADDFFPYDPVVQQLQIGGFDGIVSDPLTPVITGGFTAMIRARPVESHDGTRWALMASDFGVGTGGFRLSINASAETEIEIWNGVGSLTADYLLNYAGEHWVAARWQPAGDGLSLWVDGAKVAVVAAGGFVPLDPGLCPIGVGIISSGNQPFQGDHRDALLFERALTDDEMAEIAADMGARSELRDDPDLILAYLPGAHNLEEAKRSGSLRAADQVQAASVPWHGWGRFYCRLRGQQGLTDYGRMEVNGLQSQRLATITAGNVVRVSAAGVSTDEWIEVYGRHNGTGLGVVERFHVVGTTPLVGTVPMSEVYGIAADNTVGSTITVQDAGTLTNLYQIPSGQIARGVHLFHPPLRAGPSAIGIVANGATTSRLLVAGCFEQDDYQGAMLTLSGTTRVIGSDPVDTIRAIAVGYVADARVLTIDADLIDPEGTIQVFSDDAGEAQRFRLYYVGVDGRAGVVEAFLDGTTTVDTFTRIHRFCGLELDGPAVGLITIMCEGGATSVLVGEILPGDESFEVDKRPIDIVGRPEFRLEGTVTTPRQVVAVGYDEAGALVAGLASLSDDRIVTADQDFVEILGFGMGHVPYPMWVSARGTAWRESTPRRTQRALDDSRLWSSASVSDALDAEYGFTPYQPGDAAMPMEGSFSVAETATVTVVTPTTNVITVSPVAGSYGTGDLLRRE